MSISSADLQAIIANEDDFGFEMRVGGVLRKAKGRGVKHEVKHAGTYIDPVESKPRQFDYICSLDKDHTRVALTIECKNVDPSYPIVVCGTERPQEESYQDMIVSVPQGRDFTLRDQYRMGPCSFTKRGKPTGFYLQGDFVGKSLIRIIERNGKPVVGPDKDIYERWAQALACGVRVVEAACVAAKGTVLWSAILPVVVVPDDSLWKVAYDELGNPSNVEKVELCTFYVGNNISVGSSPVPHDFAFSHIHFFTLKGLASFLTGLASDSDLTWVKLFGPHGADLESTR